MLERTVTLILADDAGPHLLPLTAERAKAAVPFGGKYRMIDFVMSNCAHSGLQHVFVLPPCKARSSRSLCKHLGDGWSHLYPSSCECMVPAPRPRSANASWYEGTADAVYHNLDLLDRSGAEWVVVLSGDHIYRMDYQALLGCHVERNADVTVACSAVPVNEARRLTAVEVDLQQWMMGIRENPADPATLPEDPSLALVSMGVYIFSCEVLIEALREDQAFSESTHDFGRDILPRLIPSHRVQAYSFGGAAGRVTTDRYWRDVSTIDSYYRANLELLEPLPPLDLYQLDWQIRTAEEQNPPARTIRGRNGNEPEIINSLLCEGTIVSGGSIWNSILSRRVRVEDDAVVEASVLFDGVHIGPGARLKKCIVDKSVHIPAGTEIGFDLAADQRRFTVSDEGVVVVPQGYRFTDASNGEVARGTDATDATPSRA